MPEQRCLVTAFIPGTPIDAEQLRDPRRLAQVGRALARVHAGAAAGDGVPDVHASSTSTPPRRASAARASRRTTRRFARELSARIAGALHGPEHEPVPCHNDLLTANFIDDGERLRIVDWEYAGMNDRYFDLGNLSVNNGLGEDDDRILARGLLRRARRRRGGSPRCG